MAAGTLIRTLPEPTAEANDKELALRSRMQGLGSVLVAYSGGVDSSYLAVLASQELRSRAFCVLGISPSVSAVQREEAVTAARQHSLDLRVLETAELADERYASNSTARCYFCKSELYSKLAALADELGVAAIADGTNSDDLSGHRPGRAAAAEHGVISPLADVGLSKEEIRSLSRRLGIRGWEKPATPCLASRLAYGTPVTSGSLGRVERAEEVIRQMGFREFRVRAHDRLARIEIAPAELPLALRPAFAQHASDALRRIGFDFITLDLEGFRSGSLNAVREASISNANLEKS